MGTGAKIAIGCGCVVLLGAAAVIGVLGAGAWWAKGKVDEATGGIARMTAVTEEIERFEKQANANSYTAPADGVIPEPRFLKFMDTRKQVLRGLRALRGSAARAAEEGGAARREAEPQRALVGRRVPRRDGRCHPPGADEGPRRGRDERGGVPGHPVRGLQVGLGLRGRERVGQAARRSRRGVDVGGGQAAAGGAARRRGGGEAAGRPRCRPGQREGRREAQEGMARLGDSAGEALYVPKANVELFRRHQADIKKYAMHGLAFIGLSARRRRPAVRPSEPIRGDGCSVRGRGLRKRQRQHLAAARRSEASLAHVLVATRTRRAGSAASRDTRIGYSGKSPRSV